MQRVGLIAFLWMTSLTGILPAKDDMPEKVAATARLAKDILKQHCGSCHEGERARSDLQILNRRQLIDQRGVIVPGRPEVSELLILIESGMMPPGSVKKVSEKETRILREWIASGAPEPPPPVVITTGEDYILTTITKDWKEAVAANKRSDVRYVSFNHLLGDERTRKQIPLLKAELETLLKSLSNESDGPFLQPIPSDKPSSIFRLDLQQLNWQKKPFLIRPVKRVKGKKDSPSDLMIHDLVLLEYPYAVVPFHKPQMTTLVEMFRQTTMVRPVAYVRGDWLLGTLGRSPMYEELAALAKKTARKPDLLWATAYVETGISRERALAESGWKGASEKFDVALRKLGLQDLIKGMTITRTLWEKQYPQLIKELDLGTALLPVDALSVPRLDIPGVEVEFDTIDFATKRHKSEFKPNEKLAVRIQVNQQAKGMLIFNSQSSEKAQFDGLNLPANKPVFEDNKNSGWNIEPGSAEEQWILYAVIEMPGQVTRYPTCTIVYLPGSKVFRDRVIHPIYQLSKDGTSFEGVNPERMIKASSTFRTKDE